MNVVRPNKKHGPSWVHVKIGCFSSGMTAQHCRLLSPLPLLPCTSCSCRVSSSSGWQCIVTMSDRSDGQNMKTCWWLFKLYKPKVSFSQGSGVPSCQCRVHGSKESTGNRHKLNKRRINKLETDLLIDLSKFAYQEAVDITCSYSLLHNLITWYEVGKRKWIRKRPFLFFC
jgi:hypothetical protein